MAEYLPDRIFAPSDIVKELADSGQTPFYMYDQSGLETGIRTLHGYFTGMRDYQNYFPLRENINPHILRILQKHGTGVSVCSYAELKLAQSCGFCGNQILYEPSRKDCDAEALAEALGVVWLINGEALLPNALPKQLLLRYHPSDRRMTPMQIHNVGKSKHGFTCDQLLSLIPELHNRGAAQIGLALQVASYSIQPGFWENKAEALLKAAAEIHATTGVPIWACHIGEGPGLPYRPQTKGCDLKEEAEKVERLFRQIPKESRPVLFTGVSKQLLEPHGILVTKILEKRVLYRTFLVVDAGACQYIRPVLKQAYRHISVLGRNEIENRRLYTLVGELPDSFDRLDAKGRMLPQVVPGDYCVIHDVGCGGRSMPLLYGLRPVAAEYLYEADGTVRLIAPRRSEEEVAAFLTAW